MNQATVQDGRVVVQNVQGRQTKGQGNNATVGGQDNAIDEDVDEQPVQDLALNVDNVFQADDCDAFDSDVDEAPMAQTMFMANLSSAYPVYDEAGPFYDSDITIRMLNVSSVQNDAYMMIFNDMHESHAQSVSDATRNTIVDNSLIVELATYKEQVKNMYLKEGRNLINKLHSVKNANLTSLHNHNKSMVEEVTSLKKDFKQKENKYLEEFLDMKALKEKVEDKLYKQDQSLQTVHRFIKNNHVSALVHNTEDTLKIAEITRRKMNDKMKDPECVTHKSQNIIKMKEEALKKQTTALRPIKALTVYPPNTPATLVPRVLPTKRKNELFKAENEKVKQHYKELYDSIKITRAKHIEQTTALLTENENLKAQIHENLKCNTMESVKPRVLAPGRYAIDVEPIPPHNRNNREVHLHYLKHLKESVETLREIVEEAKVERPLDRSLASACLYTKHSQELLEYAIGTCPKDFNQRDKKHAPTPLIRKKQVTFEEQCDTSNSNTHKHVEQLNTQKTNVPVPPSTGVNCCTNASGSQPRSNTKKNRISPAKGVNKKKVEEHPRTNKSNLRTTNRVDSSSSSKRTVINSNSDSVCQTCNKCLISANHDVCVVDYLQSVKASPSIHNIHNVVRKVKQVWKPKQVRQVWKPTGKVLTSVGHQWRPTGRIFTLGEQCPLTRLTKPKVAPAKQNENQAITCANQQEPNQNWGSNFPNSPSSSVFKCRSYRSSFGIWTQAVQNI
ncbi:hypothetical protein Tco_1329677 [Tanacetum coccineum]